MKATPVLKYVILYVDSVDKALTFYRQTFGLAEKMRQGPYAELDTGAVTLALSEREFVTSHLGVKPGQKGAGSSEIGFVVPKDKVDAVFKAAKAAGAKEVIAPKEQPWGQRVSYVRDPDGHLVEICSPND
jgi:lactoylglutathione lyase